MTTTERASIGFLWNHAGRSLEFVLLYLESVVIARAFGSGLYGSYALLMGIVQLLLVASSLGLETVAFSKLPPEFVHGSPESANALFRKLATLRGLVIVGVGACVLIVGTIIPRFTGSDLFTLQLLLLLIWYYALRSFNGLVTAYYIARRLVRRVATVTILIRIAEFIAVVLVLVGGGGIMSLFLLFGVTASLQAIVLLPPLGRAVPVENRLRPLAGLGARYWLSSILEFALGRQADVLLLGIFMVDRMLIGQYDAALSLAQGVNSGLTIGLYGVSTALFAMGPDPSAPRLKRQWEAIAHVIILVLVPALVFLIVHARPVVLALYAGSFAGSIPFLQAATGVYLITRFLGGGLAADYLSARGRTDVLIYAGAISGGANVLLAIILIPFFGAVGALIATGAGALIIAGIHAGAARRMSSVDLPWKTGIALTAMAALSALLVSLWIAPEPSLQNLAWLLVCYGAVLASFSYLVKPVRLGDLQLWESHAPRLAAIASWFASPAGRISREGGSPVCLYDRQKWAFAWTPESGVIADVGSSDQPLPAALGAKAEAVLAIDPDMAALERLHNNVPDVQVLVAPAEALPVKARAVDTVLLLDVLEHTSDPRKALGEVHRVLRPGGTLILSVPNKGIFQHFDPQNLSAFIRHRRHWRSAHPHYSLREIREMFGERFQIRKIRYGGSCVFPLTFWLGHILREHLGFQRTGWLKRIGDWDNDISWGRLSYSLIVLAHNV